MPTARKIIFVSALVMLVASVCVAQFRRGGGRRFWGGDNSGPIIETEGGVAVNQDTVRTARETAPHSIDLPDWTNAPGFEKDVFTFARIIYKSTPGQPGFLGWVNDYPDGDLNLSARIQMLTSMKADPDGRVLRLTDPLLAEYPFIFITHPEALDLSDEEVTALRKYLANGGVLMCDDFWGDWQWENFESTMQRVLPDRKWSELPIEHPLFHCVFDLRGQVKDLQVPTIHLWRAGYDPTDPQSFPSPRRGSGPREMHVRAWFDDKQRLMVIALHNTDTGDGWEREGEDAEYFKLFSETRAYPLAINAIFYVLTH